MVTGIFCFKKLKLLGGTKYSLNFDEYFSKEFELPITITKYFSNISDIFSKLGAVHIFCDAVGVGGWLAKALL